MTLLRETYNSIWGKLSSFQSLKRQVWSVTGNVVSMNGIVTWNLLQRWNVSKDFETFVTLSIRSEMYMSLKLLSDRPSQREKYLNIQLNYISPL